MANATSKHDPVRQHTVPGMWLRNFLLPGMRHLFEIQRETGHCFQTAIKNASVEKDFYTVQGDNGKKHYDVEIELGKLEWASAPIIQKLISKGVGAISERERFRLSEFLAVQIYRTRMMKSFAEGSFERFRTTEESLKLLEQLRPRLDGRFETSEIEEFEARVKRGEPLADDPNFFVKYCMRAVSPRLVHAINQIHWHIETARAGTHFVIGDAPVAVRRRGRLRDPYVVGVDFHDATMFVPLSYNKILVGTWDRPSSRSVKATNLRVQELNKIAIVTSSASVFSPTDDPNIVRLVNELRGLKVTIQPFDFAND